jgi:hypothetical protein
VRLLPILATAEGEEGELAARLSRDYRQSEPWDSPHNIRLVETMPKVFRHPSRKGGPLGHTHYRVFVSPVNAKGPQAWFRSGMRGPSLDAFLFGPNPILVVEAAESVPWTKPDELIYTHTGPLPRLGGLYPGKFLVLTVDGLVQTLPNDIPEATLRALITDGQ